MNLIDPATSALLSKALDAASLRHAVHAHNIANANSQGFKPVQVQFEEHMAHLRDALLRGEQVSARDVKGVEATLTPAAYGTTVELDHEVAALSQNSLQYQALIKALDRQIGMMSLAVSDGRR
jgi:flagellar basal-body rod protein FlgB